MLEWDNASPTVRPGDVTAVTTTTITIDLDSAATLSSGTNYVIRYVDAADSPSTTQDDYAYLADDTAVIAFSTAAGAREYAL